MLRSKLFDELDETILRKFESTTLFHSKAWQRILIDGFGVKQSWVVTFSDTGAIAAMPITFIKKFFIKFCGSPISGYFTPYAGPVFVSGLSDSLQLEAVRSAVQCLLLMKVAYIEIGIDAGHYISNAKIHEALHSLGFEHTVRPTRLVDLSKGVDEIWAGFQSRARNMIRKAEKSSVIAVAEVPADSSVDLYLKLLSSTFDKQGLVLPHPRRAQLALLRELESDGKLIFVVARHEGEVVAGGIFLLDEGRLIFHSGASSSLGFKLAASSLVQWEAMREGYSRGMASYDMNGIGVESIARFKESFGGSIAHHHRWTRSSLIVHYGKRAGTWLAKRGVIDAHAR